MTESISIPRNQFSQRLKASLSKNSESTSPSRVAQQYNLRCLGKPITVHTARNWLVGKSIPTQDRLQLVAGWLDVSASWLLFGESAPANASTLPLTNDAALLADIQKLDKHHHEIALEFVRVLISMNRQVQTVPGVRQ